MGDNLVETIFEQFISIVQKLACKYCLEFDDCDFRFKCRYSFQTQLIDVFYICKKKCDRFSEVVATIDITSICFDDLCTKKWLNYLKQLARDFLDNIANCNVKPLKCSKKKKKKCRTVPYCTPLPTKCITIVKCDCQPLPCPQPKCKVIINCNCKNPCQKNCNTCKPTDCCSSDSSSSSDWSSDCSSDDWKSDSSVDNHH